MKTIYEELEKDHREVEALLDELVAADGTEKRQKLIAEIRDRLIPHARAEEAVLYNVLRDLDEAKDVVAHSYQEHVKAETLLRGLQAAESVAIHRKSGASKLRDEILHHVAEERGKVFAAARRVLSDEDAVAIGKAFVELKSKSGAGVVMSNLELVANLLPAKFRRSFTEGLDRGLRKAS